MITDKATIVNTFKKMCISLLIILTFFNGVSVNVFAKANLGGNFKSYMSFKAITDETSQQWELQQLAYTDSFGLRRIPKVDGVKDYDNDYYCVATGNYYANYSCGGTFTVTLEDDTTFDIMISDIKRDKDTDKNNQVCISNGSIIEFLVDTSKMSDISKRDGTIREFDGEIVSITKMED